MTYKLDFDTFLDLIDLDADSPMVPGHNVFQIMQDVCEKHYDTADEFCKLYAKGDRELIGHILSECDRDYDKMLTATDKAEQDRDAALSAQHKAEAELDLAQQDLKALRQELGEYKHRYELAVKNSGDAQQKFNEREDKWIEEKLRLKQDKIYLFRAYEKERNYAEALKRNLSGYGNSTVDVVEALLEAERA